MSSSVKLYLKFICTKSFVAFWMLSMLALTIGEVGDRLRSHFSQGTIKNYLFFFYMYLESHIWDWSKAPKFQDQPWILSSSSGTLESDVFEFLTSITLDSIFHLFGMLDSLDVFELSGEFVAIFVLEVIF